MSKPHRNRKRRPARSAHTRDPKPIVLIVSEGEVTEPEYLKGFAKAFHNPRVTIETIGGVGTPKTVVTVAKQKMKAAEKRARREDDENLKYDEVWGVFDIDEHPDVADAKVMARDNGILLAVSNPCIELWLWLHFAEQPGMRHRHDIQEMIKQHIPGYDKHVEYSDYEAGYDAARQRAERLDSQAELAGEPWRNPSTGVWRLADSIRRGQGRDPV